MSEEVIYINEEKELEELKELLELKEKAQTDQKKTTRNLIKQLQVKKLSEKKENEKMNDLMKEIAIDKVGNEFLGTNGVNDIEGLKDYTTDKLIDTMEEVKKINEIMKDFEIIAKGVKREDTKEDFMELFEEITSNGWNGYFIGKLKSIGNENENISIDNIETAFNFHCMLKDVELDIWASNNPPNAKLLKRGLQLGLTPEANESFKTFKRRCDLIEYPATETQRNSLKTILKARGKKAKEIIQELKIERTKWEIGAIIDNLEETTPPTEGHISFINGLQIKLGFSCTVPQNRKEAKEMTRILKLKYALKLGASFSSIEELEKYAISEARKNNCYASEIIDGLIKGFETDRKINYLKSEEVQSDLNRRIANVLGR